MKTLPTALALALSLGFLAVPGDIATHRLNAGFELAPLSRLIVNFRMSHVGDPTKTSR